MASGGIMNRQFPAIHNFNYARSKLAFNQEIGYLLLEKRLLTRVVPHRKDIDNIITDIKENRTQYREYFTEKCRVVNENGKDILCQVTVKTTATKPFFVVKIRQILCLDDLFDVLFELHMRKPRLNEAGILEHFTNCLLFNPFINLFWKSCETCSSVIKNLDMYFRPVAELTIFRLNSNDKNFTDIFMYIERNTNFVVLRPLKSVTSKELAFELLTIFADFGSPSYLDANVLKYFFKEEVLKILKSLDPPFRIPIMYANSRNHKINLMTSKAKQLLVEWMIKTGSTNWAIGIHVVQWLMNTNEVVDTYIRSKVVNGPIYSPYHAMFGQLPHTNIVKIKETPQSYSTKNKEKVLIDCSQCNLPIYKVFKCHSCHRSCHFSCCIRNVKQAESKEERPVLTNKCFSCANIDMCVDEEIILGT